MKQNLQYWILGVWFGVAAAHIYNHYKYTTFKVPKYKIGACLSNGLYFEKIAEIRKGELFGSDALYVTDTYFENARRDSRSSTVQTWIADQNYVSVDSLYCGE